MIALALIGSLVLVVVLSLGFDALIKHWDNKK